MGEIYAPKHSPYLNKQFKLGNNPSWQAILAIEGSISRLLNKISKHVCSKTSNTFEFNAHHPAHSSTNIAPWRKARFLKSALSGKDIHERKAHFTAHPNRPHES